MTFRFMSQGLHNAPMACRAFVAVDGAPGCGVTALDIWEAIQMWGGSDETSNPLAMERISNAADYVDQLLDPTKVDEARKAQLGKLWKRNAFTLMLREEIS